MLGRQNTCRAQMGAPQRLCLALAHQLGRLVDFPAGLSYFMPPGPQPLLEEAISGFLAARTSLGIDISRRFIVHNRCFTDYATITTTGYVTQARDDSPSLSISAVASAGRITTISR